MISHSAHVLCARGGKCRVRRLEGRCPSPLSLSGGMHIHLEGMRFARIYLSGPVQVARSLSRSHYSQFKFSLSCPFRLFPSILSIPILPPLFVIYRSASKFDPHARVQVRKSLGPVQQLRFQNRSLPNCKVQFRNCPVCRN